MGHDLQRSEGWLTSQRVSRMISNWTIEDPSASRANESDEERLMRETADFLARMR